MKILLVDMHQGIEQALKDLGHTVKTLRLGGGIFHLPGLLASIDFSPDYMVQMEFLGARTFFTGLDQIGCPTVFWAMDSHLGLFWQQWYARLFDCIVTPHVSLFERLPTYLCPAMLRRFAWPGQRRDFALHARREHPLGLCARVDAHRRIRAWLVDLLVPKGLCLKDGLSLAAMMDFYDSCRVVPNECIANEVNWRLMEGASCGCLVLSPDVGEDQNALFVPGKEFLLYRDGLELLDYVAWAGRCPDKAESLGLAAMQRIRGEHLPEHRACVLVDLAATISQSRATGPEADISLWLALARLLRNGALSILDHAGHAAQGFALLRKAQATSADVPALRMLASHITAQSLCLFGEGAAPPSLPRALELCRELLANAAAYGQDEGADLPGLEAYSVASALLLRKGDFASARALWAFAAGGGALRKSLPGSPAELAFAWSGLLERRGLRYMLGVNFVKQRQPLPQTALEWHYFGQWQQGEKGHASASGVDALFSGDRALLLPYVDELGRMAAAAPDDWRLKLKLGLACLAACKVGDALTHLTSAERLATRQGRTRQFYARLEQYPGIAPRQWQSLFAEPARPF